MHLQILIVTPYHHITTALKPIDIVAAYHPQLEPMIHDKSLFTLFTSLHHVHHPFQVHASLPASHKSFTSSLLPIRIQKAIDPLSFLLASYVY